MNEYLRNIEDMFSKYTNAYIILVSVVLTSLATAVRTARRRPASLSRAAGTRPVAILTPQRLLKVIFKVYDCDSL